MSNQAKLDRQVGTCIKKHGMIVENDCILIAVSGGKDSLALADVLTRLRKKSPVKFALKACTIDAGFGVNTKKIGRYLDSIGVEYVVRKTGISDTLKSRIKGSKTGDSCFLCSRLRRGFLYSVAKENGCNKIALGHNIDDRIETLLLNMFYSSNSTDMRPIYLSKEGITVIRPLIDTPEPLIKMYAKENNLPVCKAKCPFRPEDSKRKMIKKMITKLAGSNKYFYSSLKNGLDKNAA